ncbi:MAG: cation-translocating P-type ATPase [Phycisphaerales bacterium]|nr:cation-translocating P-type ATPase [Phycisphaerales bacterium]
MQPASAETPRAAQAPFTWTAPPAARGLFSTRGELIGAITCGVLLLLGVIIHRWTDLDPRRVVIWAGLGVGSLYGGRAALTSLLSLRFDIDVLMIVGAWLAAYLGHPEEGALLLFLFTLSGALEDLAMQRTKREVEALHKLMPTEAVVFRDGDWTTAAPETLVVGERIKIRPGDRVPTDATVVSGESSFDQSAITGESMPRHVKAGDELYAGTINTDDPLEARVLRPASESSLQKILNLVTQARELREPVQRIIDRLSQPYAIGVMVVSTAVLLVWWLGVGRPFENAAYTAITLLIVASPCALVIATPTATLAAIARAARAGVLFKGGQSIDRLANISSVCFDKTGTLTFGRPKLYEVHPVAWSDGKQLLAMAAALESESTHPIAAAVREAARERGIEPAIVTDTDHTAGRGVGGRYHGCPVRLGSYRHTEELIPVCFRNRVQEVLTRIQDRGHLGVVVAHACPEHPGGGQAAVLIMSDAVRPGAKPLVSELHRLGVKPVRMLTGDNRTTAERVATMLGLDRFDAEMLPGDKVAAVRAMKEDPALHQGRSGVAVIGDGVNDAPALAAADVAIAIGSIGSDAALESADIVLLSDDLAVVPWAVKLARAARRKVKLNLFFALSVIVLMAITTLVASLMGRPVPLSVGVLAHEGGTLLVVLNSLLLLRIPGVHAGESRESTREALARAGASVPQPTA